MRATTGDRQAVGCFGPAPSDSIVGEFVDLPINSRVVRARGEGPFLAAELTFNPAMIATLLLETRSGGEKVAAWPDCRRRRWAEAAITGVAVAALWVMFHRGRVSSWALMPLALLYGVSAPIVIGRTESRTEWDLAFSRPSVSMT